MSIQDVPQHLNSTHQCLNGVKLTCTTLQQARLTARALNTKLLYDCTKLEIDAYKARFTNFGGDAS